MKCGNKSNRELRLPRGAGYFGKMPSRLEACSYAPSITASVLKIFIRVINCRQISVVLQRLSTFADRSLQGLLRGIIYRDRSLELFSI